MKFFERTFTVNGVEFRLDVSGTPMFGTPPGAPVPPPEIAAQLARAGREQLLQQVAFLTLWLEAAEQPRESGLLVPSRAPLVMP